jgi:mono/diheme cytochrome c family protein
MLWGDVDRNLPADSELLDQIRDALDFRLREEFDRNLDAVDPGELLEHARLSQKAIDRGIFGLDALFVVGDELFEYEFRPNQGLGNRLAGRAGIYAGGALPPNMRRVHQGAFGGPDSHNCATCHFKGGPDGAGNNTQNAFLRGDGNSTLTADERNPPHLLGLGSVQALAYEMTADLRKQRDDAVVSARESGAPVDVILSSKGVEFGSITASEDGTVDTTKVDGVDRDLIVKPFGWKGHSATLREIAEESFRIHLGIVSMHDQRRFRDLLVVDAHYGDGDWYDVDRDGVTIELEEGMLTTMVSYLAQLEIPVVRPPRTEALLDHYARGQRLFDDVGCASCHRPHLELHNPVIEVRPRGPDHADAKTIRIDVARDGEHPKIEPQAVLGNKFNVPLFSDLRRHDLGEELASPAAFNGVAPSVFLTRSLWGLAFTAPYLHDGRAPTIDDAVRAHGGEAATSRDRYDELEPDERAALQVFLLSLTRQPKLFVP